MPLLNLRHCQAKFLADFDLLMVIPDGVPFEVSLEHRDLDRVLLLFATIASEEVVEVFLLDSESSHLKVQYRLGADPSLLHFLRSAFFKGRVQTRGIKC